MLKILNILKIKIYILKKKPSFLHAPLIDDTYARGP